MPGADQWSRTFNSTGLVSCLLPGGAEVNDGLTGKTLQAVTSFGFRMFHWTEREGWLLCVCVCVCVCFCLIGDMLKSDRASEFVGTH